jgi:hypothetical protein
MPQKPESRLQKKMVDHMRSHGAWAQKTHGNRFSSGLPDIIGVHMGVGFGVEVKTPDNKSGLTVLQRRTLQDIKRAGGVAGEARTLAHVERVLVLCEQKAGLR